MDLAEAERRYGPRIDGDVPTRMWVAQVDGRDVGMVQDYRVGDHADYAEKTRDPEAAAFDYLIGDPDLVGRGIGTRIVGQFLRERLRPAYPDAPRFLLWPADEDLYPFPRGLECARSHVVAILDPLLDRPERIGARPLTMRSQGIATRAVGLFVLAACTAGQVGCATGPSSWTRCAESANGIQ